MKLTEGGVTNCFHKDLRTLIVVGVGYRSAYYPLYKNHTPDNFGLEWHVPFISGNLLFHLHILLIYEEIQS